MQKTKNLDNAIIAVLTPGDMGFHLMPAGVSARGCKIISQTEQRVVTDLSTALINAIDGPADVYDFVRAQPITISDTGTYNLSFDQMAGVLGYYALCDRNNILESATFTAQSSAGGLAGPSLSVYTSAEQGDFFMPLVQPCLDANFSGLAPTPGAIAVATGVSNSVRKFFAMNTKYSTQTLSIINVNTQIKLYMVRKTVQNNMLWQSAWLMKDWSIFINNALMTAESL